jgi:putative holliday junction resolvase
MKYLGIDFGEKRIGLAVSDDEGGMAFPYEVILNDQNLLETIRKIIEKEKIDEIVIGESKNFEGEPNKIMVKIEEFKKALEGLPAQIGKTKLKINLESEFMTSAQAERIQGKTEMHDASAAAIILQSYLDRR